MHTHNLTALPLRRATLHSLQSICTLPYRLETRMIGGLALLILLLFGTPAHADVNVRTNPIYVVIGAVNVEVDFAIDDRWTIGPIVTVDAVLEDYLVGVRINRYRHPRDTNGWYTGLTARYSPTGLGSGEEFVSVRISEHYQWQWDNFNLALGIGPDLRREGEDWALWVGTDLSLGWRF